jgi:pimeloyl-ACP methyl ester carboxylesterase
MSMPTVELSHGTIEDRREGPEEGPPIVFVHGALVNGSLWAETGRLLAASGHRTFIPDLPLGSHRVAFDADADLSPTGQARILASYLEQLDLSAVTLVANDTGGAVVQFMITDRPSRVGRVVFTNCDTFDRFPPPPFDRMFKLMRRPELIRVGMAPMRFTSVRHSVAGYGGLMRKPADAAQTRDWVEPCLTDAGVRRDFAKFARGIDPGQLVANAERLRAFSGPVLVAWATSDRFFPMEDGRQLAGCFDQARVVEIPDSGTFVAHDQPERLASEVESFITSTSAATSS